MRGRLLIILAALAAYWLQTYFYLEGDVIYLVHAAQKLLHGGSYLNNYFETNPPLIFYLYFPIVFCMQLLKLNLIVAARIYIIALALAALYACDYLMKLSQLSSRTRHYLLAAITLVLLFLPSCEFGQREHLLLILTMPYWFLMLLRTEKTTVPTLPALLTGIAAGLGFALKPFFLPPLILSEIYFCLRERNIFFLFRIETLSIFLLFSLYGLSLFIFQPDYVHFILPWVSKYYFSGAAESWNNLLDHPPALFCLVVALFTPAFYKMLRSSALGLIFSFALLGFILSFLLPKTAWYYHVLPAFGMCLLLGALLIAEMPNKLMAGGLALLFLVVPVTSNLRLFHSEYTISNNQALNDLIQFADSSVIPTSSIYCIPTHHACSIVSAYSNTQYVSRFPSFWALRGILSKDPTPSVKADENYMLNLLVSDLDHKKPNLIIFDDSVSMHNLKTSQEYIAYFSQQAEFKKIWKHYHYLKSIGPYEIYGRML